MTEQKFCGVCKELLSLNEFYECPTGADGRAGRCIECSKLAVSQQRRRWNEEGLTTQGKIPDAQMSERAIEREREKRRIEKQVEVDLRQEIKMEEFESSESVFQCLSGPTRQGDKKVSGWSVH